VTIYYTIYKYIYPNRVHIILNAHYKKTFI